MNRLKCDLKILKNLTIRNLKNFLKDKMSVFFSLMAPLIVFVLYILFLSDIQVTSVMGLMPESAGVLKKDVKAFIDCWMIAGVLGTACITVSLGSNIVMIQDKVKGKMNDFLSSPIKKPIIIGSYFLFNFIVTLMICFIVLIIGFIYLAATSAWYLSVGDVFEVLGILILSVLSATFFTTLFATFFNSEATISAVNGIFGSAIGFVIGAYIPMFLLPTGVEYFASLIPGTHSAGLFRNVLMRGSLDNLTKGLHNEFKNALIDNYSMKINFFGISLEKGYMYLALCISILIFILVNFAMMFKYKKSLENTKLNIKEKN